MRHWCSPLRIDGSASWQIPCPTASCIPPRSQHPPLPTAGKEEQGSLSHCVHPGVAEPFSGLPNMQGSPVTTSYTFLCQPLHTWATPEAQGMLPTVLRAEGCVQGLRETLPGRQANPVGFFFHVHSWHKQNIFFSDQNTELFPWSSLNSCCIQTKLR